MLTNLQPLQTQLRQLQEIPTVFFQRVEEAHVFDEQLFPGWVTEVFDDTDLKNKFKVVYDKYKAIESPNERALIVSSFINNNKVQALCQNLEGFTFVPVGDLHLSIREDIESTFAYLYNTAMNYHGFTDFAGEDVKTAIDRFIGSCNMQICPMCGLEGYLNLGGQARLALDHWLCQDIFPSTAVNFDNLFPLGDKCNSRPVKSNVNILINDNGVRTLAFYPFTQHNSIKVTFAYLIEPSISPPSDDDWALSLVPNSAGEQNLFDSWQRIFNIEQRYHDYCKKYIIPFWESNFKRFLEESELGVANDIDDLKDRLKLWKASFPLNIAIGAIIYKAFIDNLINNCSNAYLYSLCENFKRQAAIPVPIN